ncbi:hypothetical protein BO71DRAFT_231429 [Aspergillus ellipticus CBS 707.79]|uniref:Uncharacterized protein n=1 Tax=Aspergillus ellipticus CBS 707.79 TaxID=1448320 RepID=A0A319DAZ1_9EURO|nr:hypothetical protein BO71DRAFT_231429 [Aspergillus ellipticus CBS 707.79]
MGVAESKLLAQNLLGACRKAETEGKARLDGSVFWEDETISKIVKSICKYIPQDIRGLSRKSDVRKAIERSHTKLRIPEVIQDLQEKQETLFPTGQTTHDTESISSSQNILRDSISSKLPLHPLARCYTIIVRYEKRLDLDKIRLRLLYVAFYRLKKKLQPGDQYEYSGAVPFIAQALLFTGSINDSFEIVQKRVRSWISRGDRYDSLAKDLGGLGVLYILPDMGGESLWTRQLPKSATNKNRISVIQNLRQLGIHAEAQTRGLHISAEGEMRQILEPLETSLNAVISRGFSQTSRLNSIQDQPEPEMSGHRGTHVSNENTSQSMSLYPFK